MIIQHLKPSQVIIVGVTAVLLVLVSLVTGYFRAKTIDPHVTLEYSSGLSRQEPPAGQINIATPMNGEVSRTADRIGEATALALSASLYVANEELRGRTPRGVRDLVAGIAAQNLLPPGLALAQVEGSFVSAYSNVSVRYRPRPLGIEVIAIGHKPVDGPALIVRITDELSEKGEAQLYIAGSLGDVRVPAPFSTAAKVIALGWSPEPLRSLK